MRRNYKDISLSHTLSKAPCNKELAERLKIAVNSLHNEFRYIDPLELNISQFNQRYLKDQLQNLDTTLKRYAWILGVALSQLREPLSDTTFIEYGGGTGFLSILARELGIGTVIYNDIYDISCKDAKEIARTLGRCADHYVHGNIDDLVSFCDKYNIKRDSMASNDVIEHIYDIDDFLSKLSLLSHRSTTVTHATGANMFFYPFVKFVTQKHKETETRDRQRLYSQQERECLLAYQAGYPDCLSAYQNERKKIIKSYMPNLGNDETERLAKATRGFRQEDIHKCVDCYVQSKKLPKLIEHPTNTCDPYTGNWAEHLMNPYYLAETLKSNGFDVELLPLFWCEAQSSPIKNLVLKSLNFMIRISNAPLYFSRGFVIYAQYSGSFSRLTHRHHIYECRRSYLWWYLMLPLWQLLYYSYDLHRRITQSNWRRFLLKLRK